MKFSTLFYVIYQGFRNTIKNKWFTLASVATIAACLFLFGIFYAVIVNFQNIVKTAEEGVSVTVFFDEGTPDERIAEIGDLIRNHTAVASANFISADEAWEDFEYWLKQDNKTLKRILLLLRQHRIISTYKQNHPAKC